jgi:hypothetical protein
MSRIRITLAIFAIVASSAALILAGLGGGALLALRGLLPLEFIPDDKILHYPLGAGVFALYAFGIALGITASRRPITAGITMLPLGVCAFIFGGPVAQIYGVVIVGLGALLAATGWRQRVA